MEEVDLKEEGADLVGEEDLRVEEVDLEVDGVVALEAEVTEVVEALAVVMVDVDLEMGVIQAVDLTVEEEAEEIRDPLDNQARLLIKVEVFLLHPNLPTVSLLVL